MINLIILGAFVSWGGLCFLVGRIMTVNKAINRQWGDQKEFNEWKNNQFDSEAGNVKTYSDAGTSIEV